MADESLTIRHSPERERYEAVLPGDDGAEQIVGYIDYVAEVETVILTHTVVPDQFSGRGYAGKLAKSVLDDIRTTGKKVVPVCSFVQSYIERHPEYANMTVEAGR